MNDKPQSTAIAVSAGRFPWVKEFEERYGVDKVQWRALIDAVFPTAKTIDSIVLALSYCKARGLDPFKRPVHIVPMYDKARGGTVDTIWPGIGELLTTASRTGAFAGRDAAIFGPTMESQWGAVKVSHPEWCEVVVYRIVHGQRMAFHGPRVYWLETYASKRHDDPAPNSMWMKRPFGQIEKCALAGSVRAAFPEEIGNEYAAEEMEGKVLEGQFERVAQAEPTAKLAKAPPKNKLAEFAKVEASESDQEELADALRMIAAVKNAKGLSLARKHAIPLMGRFDDAWPEGKEQIVSALAEADDRIAAGPPSQAKAVTTGAGMDVEGRAPAPVDSSEG